MHKTATLIGAGLVAFAATACGGGSPSASGGSGQTLTLGESVLPKPWDLAKASVGPEAPYYQPVYDTLIRLNTQNKPIPNLATSWSYDTPQTTLTMKLRTGVTFTDGSALTAQVVKANLLHTQSGTDTAAGELTDISGVDVVDTSTVAIKLKYPSTSLLSALGQVSGMIASPKALQNPQTPIGSGPYKLDTSTTTADQQYTYVRNPDYWNAKAFPYDKIVLKYIADPSARTNALLSGQIKGATVSAQKVKTVKNSGMDVITYQPGDVEGLFIWDRAGKQVPALGNVKVRQALNYAFDKQAIIKTVKLGLGTATTQLFSPGEDGYDPSLDSVYSYNPAKARQLLAEAGYPNGFSVTMPDLSSLFPQEQAVLTQSLKDIGIKVTLQNVPASQIFTSMLSGKYPMSYFKLGDSTAWNKILLELTKTSTWNPFKYSDPAANALISKIQQAPGSQQPALIKQLNSYVVHQAWDAPWDVMEDAYATSHGVKVTPQPGVQYPPIYNYQPSQ